MQGWTAPPSPTALTPCPVSVCPSAQSRSSRLISQLKQIPDMSWGRIRPPFPGGISVMFPRDLLQSRHSRALPETLDQGEPSHCGLSRIVAAVGLRDDPDAPCASPITGSRGCPASMRRAQPVAFHSSCHAHCQLLGWQEGFPTGTHCIPPRPPPVPPPKRCPSNAQPRVSIPSGWHRGSCKPPTFREDPNRSF